MPLERSESYADVEKAKSYIRSINGAITYTEPSKNTYYITDKTFNILTNLKSHYSIMQGRTKELRRAEKKHLRIENEYRMERHQILAENEQLKTYTGKLENVLTQYRAYLSEEQRIRSEAEEQNRILSQKNNTLMEEILIYQREEKSSDVIRDDRKFCDYGIQQTNKTQQSGSALISSTAKTNYQHDNDGTNLFPDVTSIKHLHSKVCDELEDAKATISNLQEIEKELMTENRELRDEMEGLVFQYQSELATQDITMQQHVNRMEVYQNTIDELERTNQRLYSEIDELKQQKATVETTIAKDRVKKAVQNVQTPLCIGADIGAVCDDDMRNCSSKDEAFGFEKVDSIIEKEETQQDQGSSVFSISEQVDVCKKVHMIVDDNQVAVSGDCLQQQEDDAEVSGLKDCQISTDPISSNDTETIENFDSISQQNARATEVTENAAQDTESAIAFRMSLEANGKTSMDERIQSWLSDLDKAMGHYDDISVDERLEGSDQLEKVVSPRNECNVRLAKEEMQDAVMMANGIDNIPPNNYDGVVHEVMPNCFLDPHNKKEVFQAGKCLEDQRLCQPDSVPLPDIFKRSADICAAAKNYVRLAEGKSKVNAKVNRLLAAEMNAVMDSSFANLQRRRSPNKDATQICSTNVSYIQQKEILDCSGNSKDNEHASYSRLNITSSKCKESQLTVGKEIKKVRFCKYVEVGIAEQQQLGRDDISSAITGCAEENVLQERYPETGKNLKESGAMYTIEHKIATGALNDVGFTDIEEQGANDPEGIGTKLLENAKAYIIDLARIGEKNYDTKGSGRLSDVNSRKGTGGFACFGERIQESKKLEKVEKEGEQGGTGTDTGLSDTVIIPKKDLGKFKSGDIETRKKNRDANGPVIDKNPPCGLKCSSYTDVLHLSTKGCQDMKSCYIQEKNCTALFTKYQKADEEKFICFPGRGTKIQASMSELLSVEQGKREEHDEEKVGESKENEQSADDAKACRDEDEEFGSEYASDFEIESLPTDSEDEPDDELDRFLTAKKSAKKPEPRTVLSHPWKQKSKYVFVDHRGRIVKMPLKSIKEENEEMCDADELLEELNDFMSM